MLGKIEGKRRKGWQRRRRLDSTTNSMDMNSSKLLEIVEDRGAWRAAVPDVAVRHNKEWTDCNTDLRIRIHGSNCY